MSVGLKDAQAETKDRAAKESVVEVEVYVAKQRTEIVQAPAHMLSNLQELEEEIFVFECSSYTPWAVGNKVGISFKLAAVLDEDFKPVDLDALRAASRAPGPGPRPSPALMSGQQRSSVAA